MTREPENVRFNILRNALYHTARRRSLEQTNRVFNLLVVLLGAAAFSDLITRIGMTSVWVGAGVALIGALQLVFDFGRQARDHQVLQRDYYNLLAETEVVHEPTPQDASEWHARMIKITGDEPPVLRAIDAKAYNDAVGAMEIDPEQRLHIPRIDRFLGGFLAFEGRQYSKLVELKRSKRLKERRDR
ncbi:hypothetical protein ATO8_18759 [Roseivivax marinus]|uniref:SMODS and SLOG-associating 2TM effector domain-containing protein n=1 Tax=Roseivivax marinus TaxID=1379903 RepID=W4HEF4_9RHOB|nr:hypothetical protein [Roseivivax marinus]ETW11089.1 hypothetical protein ATO8_18759 [Roseivivax marinus]